MELLRNIPRNHWILLLISTLIMMVGQLTNFWGTAPQGPFDQGLTPLGDGYIIGKMAYTEQHGLFNNIGLLLQVTSPQPANQMTKKQQQRYRRDRSMYSKQAYMGKKKIVNFNIYLSKVSLQVFFYSLLNEVFNPEPQALLSYIFFQKALLFSLVLSLIIIWIYKITNIYAAILMLFSFTFSPIITLMGGSLYFTPFTFFLIFLVPCILLHLDYKGKIKFGTKHYLIVAGVFLFNMLFQSFEFISTKGLMAVTPFVFYGLLKGNYKEMVSRTFKAGIFYGIAILFGLAALLLQIKTVEGSWAAAFEHIKYSYSKRASGELETERKINKKLQESTEASRIDILKTYFNEDALYWKKGATELTIKYKTVFYLYLISAVLLFFFQRKIPTPDNKNMMYALIFGTLFAFLAPLSWHIIFRGHSYIHVHFNTLLWLMPFMIFGWMLVGYTIELGVKYFKGNKDVPVEIA